MKRTTIGEFIIYASEMVPEGCIFFINPKDEDLLIEAMKIIEDLTSMNPEQKKQAQAFMLKEMKSHLTRIK